MSAGESGAWASDFERDVSELVMGLSKGGLAATPMGDSVGKIADLIEKDMMPKVQPPDLAHRQFHAVNSQHSDPHNRAQYPSPLARGSGSRRRCYAFRFPPRWGPISGGLRQFVFSRNGPAKQMSRTIKSVVFIVSQSISLIGLRARV